MDVLTHFYSAYATEITALPLRTGGWFQTFVVGRKKFIAANFY